MVRTLHHPPHDISVTVGLAAILGLLFALASGIGQIDNTPERATLGARGVEFSGSRLELPSVPRLVMVCGDETDHVITYAASDSQYRFLVSRGCRDFADAHGTPSGCLESPGTDGRPSLRAVVGPRRFQVAVEMAKNPSRSWIACRWSAHPKQQPKCLPRGCSAAR